MYEILFYKDKQGREPVYDYILELSKSKGKENRGKYVLLHQFMKRTQKTPKKEIEKAKRELADFRERS